MNARWILIPLLLAGFLLVACSPARTGTPYADVNQAIATAVKATQVVKAYPAPASASAGGSTASSALNAGSPGGMVVKDAQMDLLVDNSDQALDQVLQMAADYGGYVISSQTWYKDQYKYATVRLGLPEPSFENALNSLRHMGRKVTKETASGNDVSSEYVDLQSKLANLEATSARVRGFLDNATSVEESLRINQTLTDLEGQIEQVKGQMNYYEGRSAYSTVTVNLNPFIPDPLPAPTLIPTPVPAWNPGATFKDASSVLVTTLHGVIELLIWVFVALGPYVLIFGFIYWLYRRLFSSRSSRGLRQG